MVESTPLDPVATVEACAKCRCLWARVPEATVHDLLRIHVSESHAQVPREDWERSDYVPAWAEPKREPKEQPDGRLCDPEDEGLE